MDIEQYYLDLKKANTNISTTWNLEYRATETYGLSDISAASLVELSKRMKAPGSREFQRFWKYHRVSLPQELQKECDLECQASFTCGITELSKEAFDQCVQNTVTSSSYDLKHSLKLVTTMFLVSLLLCFTFP